MKNNKELRLTQFAIIAGIIAVSFLGWHNEMKFQEMLELNLKVIEVNKNCIEYNSLTHQIIDNYIYMRCDNE